jgi:hypothetical protein
MPYWNRALLVIPVEDKPVLLCSLSPRVYPWIKSVTMLEEIKPSPHLIQRVFEMSAEKGWKKIGVLDLAGLPYDLYTQLYEGDLEPVDVPWSAVRPPALDQWELTMYRRAATMARDILAQELAGGVGLVDHEFVARLERRFRRAGAEDLVILTTNGETPPAPPKGATLSQDFSVSLALEYRGHWVKLARNHASVEPAPVRYESLSGPYPYESCERPGEPGVFATYSEVQANGRRIFYGDTVLL